MDELTILSPNTEYKPVSRQEWLAGQVASYYKGANDSGKMFADAQLGISPAERKQDVKNEETAQKATELVAQTAHLDDAEFNAVMDRLNAEMGNSPAVPQMQTPKPSPIAMIVSSLASLANPSRGSQYFNIPFQVAQQQGQTNYANDMNAYKAGMGARGERIDALGREADNASRKAVARYNAENDAIQTANKQAFEAGENAKNREFKLTQAEEVYRKGIRQLYNSANTSTEKQIWGEHLASLGEIDPELVKAEVSRIGKTESAKQTSSEQIMAEREQRMSINAQKFAWAKEDRPYHVKKLEDDMAMRGIKMETAKHVLKKYELAEEFIVPELEAKLELLKARVREVPLNMYAKRLEIDYKKSRDFRTIYNANNSGLTSRESELRKAQNQVAIWDQQLSQIGKRGSAEKYSDGDTRTVQQVYDTLKAMRDAKQKDIDDLSLDIAKRKKVLNDFESKYGENFPKQLPVKPAPATISEHQNYGLNIIKRSEKEE